MNNLPIILITLAIVYFLVTRKNVWISAIPLFVWVGLVVWLFAQGQINLLNLRDLFMLLLGTFVLIGTWATERDKVHQKEVDKMAVKDL